MSAVIVQGGQEVLGVNRIEGPIVFVEGAANVSYDEVVEIRDSQNRLRRGRVLEVGEKVAVIQIFAGSTGLSIDGTRIRFLGDTLRIPVAEEMLGRVFDGLGNPIDGGPQPLTDKYADVNGQPINPTARVYPRDYIQTGISAIDGMNTLLRGQKLPIFSGAGMPHDQLAAQIVRQATLGAPAGETSGETEQFAIVFAAMGVKHDVADFFRKSFMESGALTRVAMFLNLADDPPVERLVTPRAALTLAEYLAYEKQMHVLVVLTDMTNYCEALRQISNIRGEVPSRKGYPGYLYSDLASLYERTGRIRTSEGSITQIPILTMPNDDITHPVPDLTGYITEGQITLGRELYFAGVYPPIAVLPSLSRLMKDGIGGPIMVVSSEAVGSQSRMMDKGTGKDRTRADHPHLAAQLYAAYAHTQDVRALASVIGEEELGDIDKKYLQLGRAFEHEFVNQSLTENRTIEQTLNIAWKLLSMLPKEELTRVSLDELKKYYRLSSPADQGKDA
jgi:V/A-type H+-transporting ATPase subunit B